MRKPAFKLLVPVLFLLALGACGEEAAKDCDPLAYDPLLQNPDAEPACYIDPDEGCGDGEWVTIKSVYDGDTATLEDDSKIRLLGINAPEMPKGGDDGLSPSSSPDTCMGKQGAALLKSLIEGKEVCIRDSVEGKQNDPYGRRLVYVYAGGFNVNMYMVATGHACAFDKYPEPECLSYIKTAEEEAEGKGLGIWGICAAYHQDPCAFAK